MLLLAAAPSLTYHSFADEHDTNPDGDSQPEEDYDDGEYYEDSSSEQDEASPFDDVVTISEEEIVTVNALANDRAYFGWDTPLEIMEANQPEYGVAIVNSDNTITYSPSQIPLPSGYEKVDVIEYTATADGLSAYTGTITIWIQQVNDAPVALSANYTINENVQTVFYLAAHDEDNDSVTYEIISTTQFGTSEVDPYSGMVIYTPLCEFSGKELLTFQVSDGRLTSEIGWVEITVLEIGGEKSCVPASDEDYEDEDVEDDEPDDSEELSATEHNPPSADAGSDLAVLAGDTVVLDGSQSYDEDGDPITYSWSQISGPAVTLDGPDSPLASFTAPSEDSETTMSFELTVSDGLYNDSASVTVTVVPISFDLIPHVYPNVIDLGEPDAEIPVAIFGSSALDVSSAIDEDLLALGPDQAPAIWFEHVDSNGDGLDDHISYYRTGDLGLTPGEKSVCFTGSVEGQSGSAIEFNKCWTVKVKA